MTRRALRLMASGCLVLVLSMGGALAQDAADEPHVLLQMLAMVPDVTAAYQGFPWVSYGDIEAAAAAWPGAGPFDSWEAFAADRDGDGEASARWIAATNRAWYGWPDLVRVLNFGDEMEAAVGFDPFEVDQMLTFGGPPSTGVLLRGDFDAEAVVDAYASRDYGAAQVHGATLLSVGDEDAGLRADLPNRNPPNPFGGQFGRPEPLALWDGVVANSPSLALTTDMTAAAAGDMRSLLDRPNFAAAAEAITAGEGVLVAALFLNPLDVGFLPAMPDFVGAALANPGVDLSELTPEPDPAGVTGRLPGYNLAVLADRQEGDEQVAQFALVYGEEAEARAGADEVAARLRFFNPQSRSAERPLVELVGATIDAPRVFHSESTGLYVALVSLRYPSPPAAPLSFIGEPVEEGETGMYAQAGVLVRQFFQAMQVRELTPLAVVR